LNKNNRDEIEWKMDGKKIVPKSLNLIKLVKSEFKKTIKFRRIAKKEYTKLFERSFSLYANNKIIKKFNKLSYSFIESINQRLVKKEKIIEKFEKNLRNFSDIFENNLRNYSAIFEHNFRNFSEKSENNFLKVSDINEKRYKKFENVFEEFNINFIKRLNKIQVKQMYKLEGHSASVHTLAKLDNDELASGSGDKSIIIWDLKTRSIKYKLLGHSDFVYSLESLDNRI